MPPTSHRRCLRLIRWRNRSTGETAACDDGPMIANIDVAKLSLHGLALGDAFGETWFFRRADEMEWLISERIVANGPWPWTDDTAMALSMYRMLLDGGEINQDGLA